MATLIKKINGNNKAQILGTYTTLEEARVAIIEQMATIDKGGDYRFIVGDEEKAAEIELIESVAEADGLDASSEIEKIKSWQTPCIIDQTSLEEVCNAAGDSYHFDNYHVAVVSDEAIERQRIGSMIASVRIQAGLSVRKLAELCGVSAQNITKIENGRYNASLDIISRILTPLGKHIGIEDT